MSRLCPIVRRPVRKPVQSGPGDRPPRRRLRTLTCQLVKRLLAPLRPRPASGAAPDRPGVELPDPLRHLPAHAVLNERLRALDSAIEAHLAELEDWEARGAPLDSARSLELANEELRLCAHDLAHVLDRGDELLAAERDLARRIGPRTAARIAELTALADLSVQALAERRLLSGSFDG